MTRHPTGSQFDKSRSTSCAYASDTGAAAGHGHWHHHPEKGSSKADGKSASPRSRTAGKTGRRSVPARWVQKNTLHRTTFMIKMPLKVI